MSTFRTGDKLVQIAVNTPQLSSAERKFFCEAGADYYNSRVYHLVESYHVLKVTSPESGFSLIFQLCGHGCGAIGLWLWSDLETFRNAILSNNQGNGIVEAAQAGKNHTFDYKELRPSKISDLNPRSIFAYKRDIDDPEMCTPFTWNFTSNYWHKTKKRRAFIACGIKAVVMFCKELQEINHSRFHDLTKSFTFTYDRKKTNITCEFPAGPYSRREQNFIPPDMAPSPYRSLNQGEALDFYQSRVDRAVYGSLDYIQSLYGLSNAYWKLEDGTGEFIEKSLELLNEVEELDTADRLFTAKHGFKLRLLVEMGRFDEARVYITKFSGTSALGLWLPLYFTFHLERDLDKKPKSRKALKKAMAVHPYALRFLLHVAPSGDHDYTGDWAHSMQFDQTGIVGSEGMSRKFSEDYGEYLRKDFDFIDFLWKYGPKFWRHRDSLKTGDLPTPRTYVCARCLRADLKLLNCAGCNQVMYCGAKCQRKHWKVHKSDCKAWQRMKKGESPVKNDPFVCESIQTSDNHHVIFMHSDVSKDLKDGDQAIVNGLTSEKGKAMNGRRVKLVHFHEERDRWEVTLDGRTVLMKAENLTSVSTSSLSDDATREAVFAKYGLSDTNSATSV